MASHTPPSWPRGLSAPLAAAYVGLSLTTWHREVAAGNAPRPVPLTPGRHVWLRDDLDHWLDDRAGRGSASGSRNPWLARIEHARVD